MEIEKHTWVVPLQPMSPGHRLQSARDPELQPRSRGWTALPLYNRGIGPLQGRRRRPLPAACCRAHRSHADRAAEGPCTALAGGGQSESLPGDRGRQEAPLTHVQRAKEFHRGCLDIIAAASLPTTSLCSAALQAGMRGIRPETPPCDAIEYALGLLFILTMHRVRTWGANRNSARTSKAPVNVDQGCG